MQIKKMHASFWLAMGLVLAAGILARTWDLATHFTHIDDIGVARNILMAKEDRPLTLASIRREFWRETDQLPPPAEYVSGELDPATRFWNALHRMTRVPRNWTYAPLQFFGTYALVHPGQSYRELLFWGRLPSCIAGILTLLAMIGFYRVHDRLSTPAVLVAVTLLALSWENIIYAKQMSNYALGVLATVLVLGLLAVQLKSRYTWPRTLLTGALLASLIYAQYQILFLLPAFYLTLGLDLWHREKNRRLSLSAALLCSGLLGLLLLGPLYFFFLRHHTAGVIAWNAGPAGEFLFPWDPALPLTGRLLSAIRFLFKNFYWVFASNLSAVPEKSWAFMPLLDFLLVLFAAGAVRLAATRRHRKKMLGIFILLVGLTWLALVLTRRLTLSPTRHSLVLLPFMAILIAEGWNYAWIQRLFPKAARLGPAITAGIWLLFFALYFPSVIAQRQDPFQRDDILPVLEEFGVDTLLASDWTWNIGAMQGFEKYNLFEEGMPPVWRKAGNPPYSTLAYLSHRTPLTEREFIRVKDIHNQYYFLMRRMNLLLFKHWQDYALIYRREIKSDSEVDFLNKTKNGSNNLYFYVLKQKA